MSCDASRRLLRIWFWFWVFRGRDVENVLVLGFYFDLGLRGWLLLWCLRNLSFCFWLCLWGLLRFRLFLSFSLFILFWFEGFWWFFDCLFRFLSLLFRSLKFRLFFNFCNCFSLDLCCLRSYLLCWHFWSFILIIRLSWRFTMFTLEVLLFH